jgi:hypothetical protein
MERDDRYRGGAIQSIEHGSTGDPPCRCAIRGYRPTPHDKATLAMVADLRSTPTVRILMHEREETEGRSSAPISKDHTYPETDPRGLGC